MSELVIVVRQDAGSTYLKAQVLLDKDVLTIEGPLYLTLDQWVTLRAMSADHDDEGGHTFWVCTATEYETWTGERAP